jgi:hypothetical protein
LESWRRLGILLYTPKDVAMPADATDGAAISGNVLPFVLLFVLARRELSI